MEQLCLLFPNQPLPSPFYYTPSGRIRKKTKAGISHEYTWGTCTWCGVLFLGICPHERWRERFCSRLCRGYARRKDGNLTTNGYRRVGGRSEHLTVAEKALGRRLKRGEIVHHVNLKKIDNRNCNLLICDTKYHQWLHHRMERAYAERHFTW